MIKMHRGAPNLESGTYELECKTTYKVYVEKIVDTLWVRKTEDGKDLECTPAELNQAHCDEREVVACFPCREADIAKIIAVVTTKESIAPTKTKARR